VINESFRACDSHELLSADEASKQGIKAALAIGSDEVANGKEFFGAEVLVERDGQTVGRFVVSIGASPLH